MSQIHPQAQYIPPDELNEHQIKALQQSREIQTLILGFIDGIHPTREASLARTNIEQGFMWLNKAISRDPGRN